MVGAAVRIDEVLEPAVAVADTLDARGDRAGARRLRDAIAFVRHDGAYGAVEGFEEPLALMETALPKLDGAGRGCTMAAIHLQAAIDSARTPPAGGFPARLDLTTTH